MSENGGDLVKDGVGRVVDDFLLLDIIVLMADCIFGFGVLFDGESVDSSQIREGVNHRHAGSVDCVG